MTTAPAADSAQQTTPDASPGAVRGPAPSRRELGGWAVFVLLPLSALAALFVLHLMAAAAAAATGGCGGG